jgi:hypothetical protein
MLKTVIPFHHSANTLVKTGYELEKLNCIREMGEVSLNTESGLRFVRMLHKRQPESVLQYD